MPHYLHQDKPIHEPRNTFIKDKHMMVLMERNCLKTIVNIFSWFDFDYADNASKFTGLKVHVASKQQKKYFLT
jgi:hypothetical protein